MNRTTMKLLVSLLLLVAICTPARSVTLDGIDDARLRDYAALQLARGAPSLEIPSRLLYRQALDLLEAGNWREAREKLLLSASLSGDSPDALFTLARVELLHGDSYFLVHLVEGFSRMSKSFYYQSLVAANCSLMLAASLVGVLMIVLVALGVRHWPLVNHWLRERYTRRFSLNATWLVSAVVLASLAAARVGIALYIAILCVVLWTYMARRERAVVIALMIMISALSLSNRYINALFPALDPGSITHRLSLVNERGADRKLLDEIAAIDDPAFRAEREYAIGTLLYRLGDYDGAKRHLLAAVTERPDFSPAYLCLGNVYFMEGEYDKALAGYQSVIAVDSTNALAYYNIGQTYIKTMLFSKSSAVLQRAGKLGIERYRSANIASSLVNLTVYDEGFGNGLLWSVALREGTRGGGGALLNEALAPFLLFPFDRLWILFAAAIAAAIAIGLRAPSGWHVYHCENCAAATCESCADTTAGIRLCADCARVIRDLSSVKVMEALLRHRRQKVWSRANRTAVAWRSIFWPGAPFIYHGRPWSGAFLALVGLGALLVLVWGGFYFKDYRVLTARACPWKIVAPIALFASAFLLSLKARRPQEPRNYRILPPDMPAISKEREATKEQPKPAEPAETAEPPSAEPTSQMVGSYLDI